MLVKDFPAVQQAKEIVQKQFKYYHDMMHDVPNEIYTKELQTYTDKPEYHVGVIADSFFPVYTYRYDEQTNILTQYKNGVEYQRMFVPEPYSLKEVL